MNNRNSVVCFEHVTFKNRYNHKNLINVCRQRLAKQPNFIYSKRILIRFVYLCLQNNVYLDKLRERPFFLI